MSIRVVHWGTGKTGSAALRGIIGHPELELVGLFVERSENVGRDAGEFCGMPATGIISTNDIEAVLALEPDCLSYFGSGVIDLDKGVANIAQFLQRGCNAVTTSLNEFIHPQCAPAAAYETLNAACHEGGSSFFATGIEPGFARTWPRSMSSRSIPRSRQPTLSPA